MSHVYQQFHLKHIWHQQNQKKKGYLKFLISQNVDGLHLRSGFPDKKLAELHGNDNKEVCIKCSKPYLRDYSVRNNAHCYEHDTGRLCDNPNCRGSLQDTIINFGESLPSKELNSGFWHSKQADLCLCLGSSLRVTPAANMPEQVCKNPNGNVVIVNLQKTPLEHMAAININSFTDQVMELLMQKLGLQIPKFTLKRKVGFKKLTEQKGFQVLGLGPDGSPFTLFPQIAININGQASVLKREPYKFYFQSAQYPENITVTLYFAGHYQELPLTLQLPSCLFQNTSFIIFDLEYDIYTRKWQCFQVEN